MTPLDRSLEQVLDKVGYTKNTDFRELARSLLKQTLLDELRKKAITFVSPDNPFNVRAVSLSTIEEMLG